MQLIFAKTSVAMKYHSFCCGVAIIAPLIYAGAEMWDMKQPAEDWKVSLWQS